MSNFNHYLWPTAISISSIKPINKDIDKKVNDIWVSKRKYNKYLYDSEIISVLEINNYKIQGFKSSYKNFVAQQNNCIVHKSIKIRPLAISGILLCEEGVVFGRRSNESFQGAGQIELCPSGAVDVDVVCTKFGVDVLRQLYSELSEELGIDGNFISKILPLGVIEDLSSGVIDLCAIIFLDISFDELTVKYKINQNFEYSEIFLVKKFEFEKFIINNKNNLVNVSKEILERYSQTILRL